MKHLKRWLPLFLIVLLALMLGACGGGQSEPSEEQTGETSQTEQTSTGPVIFLSTQARPVEEQEKMRNNILANAPVEVEFIAEDTGVFIDRVKSEVQTGKGEVSLLGALHGDFAALTNELDDLTPLLNELSDRGFPDQFVELGKLGTTEQKYIPWMQATYIFAANKEALQYLPEGADINALTWEQLLEWGKNIYEATGEAKLGFPAGDKGLLHRFLEGYLYPSYTGTMVTGFRSPEAVAMWEQFREIWKYTNPQSTTYSFMQEPLLSGEVWVAFDHTARLIEAFRERPDDFVAFPAPAGPKGRGFMPVLAGLAIPKSAPNKAGAEEVIKYLTTPEVQAETLRQIGFFPVVAGDLPEDIDVGIRAEGEAVAKQAAAPDALPALLPVGLGEQNNAFNQVYKDTFLRIIINGEDIQTVLQEEGDKLQEILNTAGAPCWPPDPPSDGVCQVK